MTVRIEVGDCVDVLRSLPECFRVNCCVTSPPYYGLRDYGHDGQIGLESSPTEYVAKMVEVFREVRRVLADDGTLWLNLGDSYGAMGGDTYSGFNSRWFGREMSGKQDAVSGAFPTDAKRDTGLRPKNLLGIPWRVAFALQADGWYLRSDIIWHKPNPMPESVTDRPTKAHEYLFLLSKSAKYYYDAAAIGEPFADERMGNPNGGGQYAKEAFAHVGPNAQSGLQKGEWNTDGSKTYRNRRSVWTVPTSPYSGAHFATFPPTLIEPCILAGCPMDGTVLDPFGGAGTTGLVADRLQRNALLIEINPAYADMARKRIFSDATLFAEVT